MTAPAETAPDRSVATNRPTVAVVCDYLEEEWPSMDLVADMLTSALETEAREEFEVIRVQPRLRTRFHRLPVPHGGRLGSRLFNLDRGVNRFVDYPRILRGLANRADLFHIVDHCYAHLVHDLVGRTPTLVTCHDLETFKSLLDPERFPRSRPYRLMAERILAGMGKATRVVCDSAAVRDEILEHGLVEPSRLRVVPLGVHPAYTSAPDPAAEAEARSLLGPKTDDAPELLHVGGTFYRKRIDHLLAIFAAVRREAPNARLMRVGGPLTEEQRRLARSLGVDGAIVELPFVSRAVLAAVYRRADLLMLPSEMEGFGFPVLEALACGTIPVVTDLPVLREVGGDAAVYCPAGDIDSWKEKILQVLMPKSDEERVSFRTRGYAQAARFTWAEHGRGVLDVYAEVLAA